LVLLEVGAGGLRAANVRGPASRPLILMYCPNRQLCHTRSPILVPVDIAYTARVGDSLLLVRNSNLSPILHRFGDIAGLFVLLSGPTPI